MYLHSTCVWVFYVMFPSGRISVFVLVSLHHQCEFVRSGVCSSVPLLWAKPISSHIVRIVSLLLPHSQAFSKLVALHWTFAFPVTSKNIRPWMQSDIAECMIHKSVNVPLAYVTVLWHFSYYLFTS